MNEETPGFSSSKLEDTQPDSYGRTDRSAEPRRASPLRDEEPQIRRKAQKTRNPEGPISGASGE